MLQVDQRYDHSSLMPQGISVYSPRKLLDDAAGRIDAQVPDATARLPAEDFSADQLKQAFQQQGLSVHELLGACWGPHGMLPARMPHSPLPILLTLPPPSTPPLAHIALSGCSIV